MYLTILLKIVPFIKRFWREILLGILIAALVFFYLQDRAETKRADEAEKGRLAAVAIANGYENLSTTYKNRYGDEVIKTSALMVDVRNMEAIAKANQLAWLNKFNGVKKDLSNLQNANTFSVQLESENIKRDTVWVHTKDSIRVIDYEYKDEFNFISAKVIDTPRFEIRDKIYSVIELSRPKNWFWKLQWGKFETKSELTNSNKLIKIDSVAVFVVKK